MKQPVNKSSRDSVIRALYGAAMGTGCWADAMTRLAEYTGCRFVSLDSYDMVRSVGSAHACNIAPDHPVLVEYMEVNGSGHELIEAAFPGQTRGAIVKGSDIYPTRKLHETEIYQSFFKPLGMKHVAGITLDLSATSITEYSFIKPHDAPEFSDRELRVLQDLQPDLTQIWLGYRHLTTVEQQHQTLQSLWDCFEHAVIVIDNSQTIRFANRAAESLLRANQWVVSIQGKLTGANAPIQARLKSGIEKLRRHQHEIISLTPEASANTGSIMTTLFRISDDQVALILTNPAISNQDFTAALQQCYQMTATEAAVINALLSGQSPRDYADRHEITYETTRTHVKNAMKKNGWRRQGEMLTSILTGLRSSMLFGPAGWGSPD